MKVTLDRDALVKTMTRLARVVERRTTIPILSNIYIEATSEGLHLKATDLDIEIQDRLPCDVSEPGIITALAGTLLDIARKLPAGAHMALETSEDSLIVRSGRSRFSLRTLPATDFPDMSAGDLPHRFQLVAKDLKLLIDKSQFAISTEETRYYLNGIYMHAAESGEAPKLRAVATDGHRLACIDVPLPEGAEKIPGVIIPRKTVAEILKLAEDAETATLELSATKIRLTFGDAILTSKLIDGTFPDYQRVIPVGNDKTMVVERVEFAKAVERVSTISTDRGRAVKLTLADGKLVLLVNNPDSGSATEEIEVDYNFPAIDIGFNARYLLDIAAQLDGDTATFKLADPGSPTLIQDREGASALYVLMPMRA